MKTTIAEIADGIFRLSTYFPDVAPPEGFTDNQFLILADEPMLYHCGSRGLFASVSEALRSIIPLDQLRWISFGHIEADECGAMNMWLDHAPRASVVYTPLGCDVSVADLSDRAPRPLAEGEVLDLGGKRIRLIETPHVPHGWEAQAMFEETGRTLFCGDILSHAGNGDAITGEDIVEAAVAAEETFQAMSIGPATIPTLRRLADLEPEVLAVMHGSSYRGDGAKLLRRFAERLERRLVAIAA